MKKIVTILIVLLTTLICSISFAGHWVILGSVAANQIDSKEIALPRGQVTIEVIPNDFSAKFTCQFSHYGYVVVEQVNTSYCVVKPLNWQSITVDFKIINLTNNPFDYRIIILSRDNNVVATKTSVKNF